MYKSTIDIGIDASRNRSGGSVAHLIGIIGSADPGKYGIGKVHVWAYSKLLQSLPERPWLVLHNPPQLEKGIGHQLWWQRFQFKRELKKAGCAIVLNTDAGSVGRFKPCVTMSRDMLSYEPVEMDRYKKTADWIRLFLLRYMQNASLRFADGAIFLTRYAADVIQKACGKLSNVAIIHHGVHERFRFDPADNWPVNAERPIRCLYVSNALPYKHQWHVIRAIAQLRAEGYPVTLDLVGGGEGLAQQYTEVEMKRSDPEKNFVTQYTFIENKKLPKFISQADLFIFASSCENMPNTLIEGMAAGLPIACSDKGPMPEVLLDGGVYFNPEDPVSIADAVRKLIDHPDLRLNLARRSKQLSDEFSWDRCADETLTFMRKTFDQSIAAE